MSGGSAVGALGDGRAGSAARTSTRTGVRAGRVGRRPDRPGRTWLPGRRSAGTPPTARGCRGAAGRRRPRSAVPASTIRPAYITATRSQTSASTDRSWLMISSPTPRSLDQVGAADRGSAPAPSRRAPWWARRRPRAAGGRPAPSRSSPAAAARRRAGAGRHACATPASPTCSSSSSTRARRPLGGRSGSWMRIGSAIWAPMRCTGFSECSAPWKTIEAPGPAQGPQRRPTSSPARSGRSTSTSPPTSAPAGWSRSTVPASVDLPHPDSPASPTTSPSWTTRSTPRTAGSGPSAVR